MSISNTLKSKKISIGKHPITSTVKTRPWCANNKKGLSHLKNATPQSN